MDRQLIKHIIAEVIHLTPARQAEACYSVDISDQDHEHVLVSLKPSLEHLTWTRIGSKDRKDLYESMVFHTGLALGNLTAWLDEAAMSYTVKRNFPPPAEPGNFNAITILSRNIEFIAHETSTWIELQRLRQTGVFHQYQYDSTKCHRDLNFVLNALCRDLEYLSNENIRSVLMEYFDKEAKCLVRRDVELCAYGFIKNLISNVMNLKPPEILYQAHTQQHCHGSAAEPEAILWLDNLIDMVISVLDKGICCLPALVNGVPRQQDKIEVLINV